MEAKRIASAAVILISVFFLFSAVVQAEIIFDPVDLKIKERVDGGYSRLAFGWGYRVTDLRWNWDFAFYEPASDDYRTYLQTIIKKRVWSNWWGGGGWRFSTQPAANYQWIRFFAEKTQRRSWSYAVWGENEWRFINKNKSSTLDEYTYQEAGLRAKWNSPGGLSWMGEIKRREKDYHTSPNSWLKYYLETEGSGRFANHLLTLRYLERTGEYPDNAWENYWGSTVGAEWEWVIAPDCKLELKGSWSGEEWGDAEVRKKRSFALVFAYPRTEETTITWMGSLRDSWGKDPVPDEENMEGEEEKAPDVYFRLGVRLETAFSPFSLRAEVFHGEEKELSLTGGLIIIRIDGGNILWELGLAPQGGYNYSAEKGYWIRIKYYI